MHNWLYRKVKRCTCAGRTCETTSPHAKINALITLLVTIGRSCSHFVYVVDIGWDGFQFFFFIPQIPARGLGWRKGARKVNKIKRQAPGGRECSQTFACASHLACYPGSQTIKADTWRILDPPPACLKTSILARRLKTAKQPWQAIGQSLPLPALAMWLLAPKSMSACRSKALHRFSVFYIRNVWQATERDCEQRKRNFLRLLSIPGYEKQRLLSSSSQDMTSVPTEVQMPLWLSRGIKARWHRTTKSVNQLEATIAACFCWYNTRRDSHYRYPPWNKTIVIFCPLYILQLTYSTVTGVFTLFKASKSVNLAAVP